MEAPRAEALWLTDADPVFAQCMSLLKPLRLKASGYRKVPVLRGRDISENGRKTLVVTRLSSAPWLSDRN